MPLTGNLRTMPFPDLMQWIAMSMKTGTLTVTGASFQKRVFFDEGMVAAVASNNPAERLGYYLVGWGFLTEVGLRELLAKQEATRKALGNLVVEGGLVTQQEMARLLRVRAEEAIFDLMGWREGEFRFLDHDVPTRQFQEVRLPVDHFLLEGARRLDELARMADAVPSIHHIPTRTGTAGGELPSAAEARMLELVDGTRSIHQIALACRVAEFDVAQAVHRGVLDGSLALLPPAAPPVPPVRRGPSWADLVREAETSLSYGDLLEAYEHLVNVRRGFAADAEALRHARAVEEKIKAQLETTPLGRNVILDLQSDLNSMVNLHFSREEAFILSRVNGRYTLAEVLAQFPGDRLHGRLIVFRLLRQEILKARECADIERIVPRPPSPRR